MIQIWADEEENQGLALLQVGKILSRPMKWVAFSFPRQKLSKFEQRIKYIEQK